MEASVLFIWLLPKIFTNKLSEVDAYFWKQNKNEVSDIKLQLDTILN